MLKSNIKATVNNDFISLGLISKDKKNYRFTIDKKWERPSRITPISEYNKPPELISEGLAAFQD
jgi:hypothetical protein